MVMSPRYQYLLLNHCLMLSDGNTFPAFAKFIGKCYFAWMETQLRMLSVVSGTLAASVPEDARDPTADEACQFGAQKLRAVKALAKRALCGG